MNTSRKAMEWSVYYFYVQETIDTAINLIFNHNPNLNITKKELKKLFLFATSQTHFIF